MFTRSLIILFILLNAFNAQGQEPSYQILGQDELSGVDIYSIIEGDDKTVWMTSNRGIIKYNGNSFQFLKSDHLKALSAFAMRKTSTGKIFCLNLFGQVLTVNNDSVEVYYQLPDSLIFSSYINLIINKEDELIINSIKDILIDRDKKLTILPKEVPQTIVSEKEQGKVYIFPIREKRISHEHHIPNVFSIFKWTGTKFIERRMDSKHIPTQTASNIVFRSVQEKYSFTTRKGGVYEFDKNGGPLYYGNLIFPKFIVSGFMEDYEGNIWYTTLGKGILVVRNPKIISFKSHFLLQNETVSIAKYHPNGTLYIGTESGKVFSIDQKGNIEEVFSNGSIIIFLIDFYKDYLLSNGGYTVEIIDTKAQISETATSKRATIVTATKETIGIGEDKYAFATSNGIVIYQMDLFNKLQVVQQYKLGRSNALYHNKKNDYLIGATVKGLFHIKSNQAKEIKHEGKKIICTDLTGNHDMFFAATTTKGILFFKGNKLIGQLTTSEGLKSDRIQNIQFHRGLLYINTSEGFQIYDPEKREFVLNYFENNIKGSRILNFELYEDEIFIVTNQDLLKFKLNAIKPNTIPPLLKIKNVWVNDLNIDFNEKSIFSHNQNKVEFQFQSIAHAHQGKLKYQYRLLGGDESWKEVEYTQNSALYVSLLSGKYTFEVKAINEDGVESEVKQYHFEILPPFWQTYWFYLLITFSATGIVIVIWRIQLKRIQRKNTKEKELISSQLTALKLQMNPHFIFNALNSIQDLILKEDTDNSYDYIVKFSNLVRMTLNYSDKDLILLEEEAEMLKLYLELENLRFTKDFNFKIENTIEEDVKIPSMLIQPFVENSVKHGLLHKEGQKNIHIKFELNDVIYCTITDNGIGIEKSKEINRRKHNKPDSVSLKSIRKRVNILQEYYKSELGVKFIHLKDNEGQPSGTKVIIKIPYELE